MTTEVFSTLPACDFPIVAPIADDQPLHKLNPQTFVERFNRKPFLIEHNLADSPLFALPRLIELAQQLPSDRIEYNAGNLPVTQDPTQTPANGLSIPETIRRIEECQSWMVLKNVELSEPYLQLLNSSLEQVREITDSFVPGMCRHQGFIFISSANSVTPFHIDPENNFLLQIRGHKRVQLFDREDREVMTEKQLEDFFTGAHRNIPYQDSFADRGEWFELNPGQGLHFPVAAPHWVKNGDNVSISFSITFQTDDSQRRQSLHRVNSKLRSLGIQPANVGAAPTIDAAKCAAIAAGKTALKLFGRK